MSANTNTLSSALNRAVELEFSSSSSSSSNSFISEDTTNDEFVSRARSVLRRAAHDAVEAAQLEDQLSAEGSGWSPEEVSALIELWGSRREDIMADIHGETVWNNRLQKMSWRIDTKAKSRKVDEMNDLVALVELVMGPGTIEPGPKSDVVRFELTAAELAATAKRISALQAKIDAFASEE